MAPQNREACVSNVTEPLESFHLRWLARYFGDPGYLPLDEEDLRAFSRSADVVEARADQDLYREGEPATAAFLVRKGVVELRQYQARGALDGGAGRSRRCDRRRGDVPPA